MALRRRGRRSDEESADEVDSGDEVGEELGLGISSGPYDSEDAPNDDLNRLDLGSLRLPVPDGAQLQVEVDRAGPVRAVHLMTPLGQLTVTAYAAPRSGGLWREVREELVAQLREDAANPLSRDGEWGREIVASTAQADLHFLGVEGPRWMLRGVAAGRGEAMGPLTTLLHDVVRQAIVVRGESALPVRSPLPLTLPEPLAEQLKNATTLEGDAPEEGPRA